MSHGEKINKRRLIMLFILAGLIILIVWIGLKTWRTYQAVTSLLDRQAQAEEIAASGLSSLNSSELEDLVYGIRGDVVTLNQELSFLMPVMPVLGWLPEVGPLATNTPHLMEMADAGTEAAAFAFRGLQPGLDIMQSQVQGSGSPLPQLLQVVEDGQPDLARASLAMDRVVDARAEIQEIEKLPWRVRQLFELADQWLPLAADGLKLTQVLPEILGYHEPKRYLLIAQNENEIRATGGFISGAGLIEINNGQIIRIDFQDANSVDAFVDPDRYLEALAKPYGEPPKALSEFMLLDLFLFRDSNYWPDFPLSAQKAMDLFSYGQDVPPLDGAIAIDQQFLSLLLSGTGPVVIPDTGETINQNNIIDSLHEAWTLQDGVLERKSFLSTFSLAIYDRLQNEPFQIDPIKLATQMDIALREKHLQIFISDPEVIPVLREVGWDGRLIPPQENDFLMVVDTNVGYNKANLFVDKDVQYQVALNDDGTGQADLLITHYHNGEASQEPCWQGTMDEYRDRAPYLALAEKCYWNFLRIYVPEGTVLTGGPQHVVPGDTWFGGYDWEQPTETINELPGFTTFTDFMLVPRAGQMTSHYTYQLPSTITKINDATNQYQLILAKQAGIPAHPVEVTVQLPQGTNLAFAEPKPSSISGEEVTFEIELDSDQGILVRYK